MKIFSLLAAQLLLASPMSAQVIESPDAIAVAENQLDKGVEEIRQLMDRMYTQIDVLYDLKKHNEVVKAEDNWKTLKGHWYVLRIYTMFMYLYKRADCKEDRRRTHVVIWSHKKEIIEPIRIDIGFWKKSMKGSESNSIQKTLQEVIEVEERILAAIDKIDIPQK